MESIQSSSCAVELKCKADKSKWHVKCFPQKLQVECETAGDNCTFFHTFSPGHSRASITPSGLMCPVVSSLAGGRTGGTTPGGGWGGVYSRRGSLGLFMIPVCVHSCWKRGCLPPSLMSCQVIALKFGPRRNFKQQPPPG